MALTIDTLKGIAGLENLAAEQLQAIVTASALDETKVVAERLGADRAALEQSFATASGVAKIVGEKPTDYFNRVIGSLKQKEVDLNTEIEALKAGGDKAELERTLSAQVTKISELTQALADKEAEFAKKATAAKVGFAFREAASSLTLKDAFQGDIAKILIAQSQNEILSKYDADFQNDKVIFKDKTTGEIARNPENGLQPFTINDLFKTTVLATAIETDTGKKGGGTKNPQDPAFISVIPGAKTQVEADIMLHDILVKKGFARGTQEYAKAQQELRVENKVSELPLR